MSSQYKFTVSAPQVRDNRFNATVKIEVPDDKEASKILHYIRSIHLKEDFMNGWVRTNAPGYGINVKGGPRPVFKQPDDRSSGVVAYEQDFQLSRSI